MGSGGVYWATEKCAAGFLSSENTPHVSIGLFVDLMELRERKHLACCGEGYKL